MKNEYDLITQKGRMVRRVCFLRSTFAPSALRPCACKINFFSFQSILDILDPLIPTDYIGTSSQSLVDVIAKQ